MFINTIYPLLINFGNIKDNKKKVLESEKLGGKIQLMNDNKNKKLPIKFVF